ncbi:MAG: ABC-type transport auxiliary lipoprotein family protein [Pseudomonadota bacterium]
MKRFLLLQLPITSTLCVLASAALLTACGTTGTKQLTTYDLGPLAPPSALPPSSATVVQPLTVAEVTSASWLDSQLMLYRLDYANQLQPRPYAASRWSMPPPQLLGQRIKARLAQNGGVVLSGTDGAVDVPLLRVEAVDFSQRFGSPTQSEVYVGLRATVLNGRILVAQKSFDRRKPALTPDAAGAAQALAETTDLVIADMMLWLAALPVKK